MFELKIETGDTIGVFGSDHKELKKLMRKVGNEVAGSARKLLRASEGSGRVYWNSGGNPYHPYKQGRHVASMPGQPPAKQTGYLSKHIKASVFRSGEGVVIKDTAFWSAALEHGASGGGRIGGASGKRMKRGKSGTRRVLEPRPFLEPALKDLEDSLSDRVRDAVLRDIEFKKQKS